MMGKIYFLMAMAMFLSCKKTKEDALLRASSTYETDQTYTHINTSVHIPAYAFGSNDLVMVSFTELNISHDVFYIDKSYIHYQVRGNYSIITRANIDQLKKEAAFEMKYFYGLGANHSDIKPYKLLFEGANGISKDSNYTIQPVMNYQIDSSEYIIKFNETQLNCLYFLGRKL